MRGRVLGALALALALSACASGGDAPAPSSSTRAAPAASPTPTVERPVKPEQEPTRRSAEAFVKYFWETYNYGNRTQNPLLMEEIATKTCGFCRSIVDNVESVSRARTTLTGFELEVLGSVTPEYKITTGVVVVSKLQQQPGRSTTQRGVVTTLAGYRSIDSSMALDWNGSTWAVAGVDNDPTTRIDW